jgi:hypothetical protein
MPRRPKRLTEAQRTKITTMLRLGGDRSMAADYARCHSATLRAEMRRDPEFANQVIQAELRNESSFLRVIQEAGKDPKQWRAAAWALERLYPERYARRPGNTLTAEQVHQLMSEVTEIVASELAKTDRQRVSARLADLETNYRSHFGADDDSHWSKKGSQTPARRGGRKRAQSNEGVAVEREEPE